MMASAARARKWLLWSAPLAVLAGTLLGAGGAAAGVILWGLISFLSPRPASLLYPNQRRMRVHRLFLGYAFCVFYFAAADALAVRWTGALMTASLGPRFLFWLGAAGTGLPLSGKAFFLRLPPWLCWAAGVAFSLVSLWVMIS